GIRPDAELRKESAEGTRRPPRLGLHAARQARQAARRPYGRLHRLRSRRRVPGRLRPRLGPPLPRPPLYRRRREDLVAALLLGAASPGGRATGANLRLLVRLRIVQRRERGRRAGGTARHRRDLCGAGRARRAGTCRACTCSTSCAARASAARAHTAGATDTAASCRTACSSTTTACLSEGY